ncbi:NKG2-D type II integral membrane protein-like [Heterocephalus glaber]|uniref:NKG2-D type II integral membrane protein-like n=1 Tax=Heterocephalus glaber TaxID=10181 RepID=A0AAX6T2Z4_HETGA|nr:NKG2-D type II integral membrane protein-like [Heterocephalus glaber]
MSDRRAIYSELHPDKVLKKPPRGLSRPETSISINDREKIDPQLNLSPPCFVIRAPLVLADFPSPPEKIFTALLGIILLISKASVLAAMVAVLLCKICGGHLTCYGVKCYYFIKESKDWNGCKLTCQDYGLSPVKIDDRDELDFLRLQLGQCYYWIGLSSDTGQNGWKWTESSASPGINARTMLPSSWEGKCAFLRETRISYIACSKTYHCICEKRMDATFPASVCSEEESLLWKQGELSPIRKEMFLWNLT